MARAVCVQDAAQGAQSALTALIGGLGSGIERGAEVQPQAPCILSLSHRLRCSQRSQLFLPISTPIVNSYQGRPVSKSLLFTN